MTETEEFEKAIELLHEACRKKIDDERIRSDPKKIKLIRDKLGTAATYVVRLRREINAELRKFRGWFAKLSSSQKGTRDELRRWIAYLELEERNIGKWIASFNKLLPEAEKAEKAPEVIKDLIEKVEKGELTLEEAEKRGLPHEEAEKLKKEKVKEEEKITLKGLKENERKQIEILHANFVRKMRGIENNMRDVADIAAVSDQTPEEKKILDLARKFQGLVRTRDLGPSIQNPGTFLNMIGGTTDIGWRRMGIIKDELVPLLNGIKQAYDNIKNARKQKEKEFEEESEEAHVKIVKLEKKEITRNEEKELQELRKSLERSKGVLERLKKIEKLEPQFSVLKKQYEEEVHKQIVRMNQALTGKR